MENPLMLPIRHISAGAGVRLINLFAMGRIMLTGFTHEFEKLNADPALRERKGAGVTQFNCVLKPRFSIPAKRDPRLILFSLNFTFSNGNSRIRSIFVC
jgi:hypothetical protein